MATLYQVQPGDTVAGIAHKLSGNPALSRNLVLSNPHKQWVMHNGQPMFQTLYIGEHLRLPNSLLRRGVNGLGATATEDPGGTDVLVGEGADAVALNNYLVANGCDKSSLLTQLTKNFQQANSLSVDGVYGPKTQNALSASMGAAAPAPCTGSGGGGGTTPVGPAKPPGGGGNVTPVSTLTTTGATNWLPWAIGIGAIVLGGVLVMAMQKNKKEAGGHPAIPSAPEHRALPAHTASKSGSHRA
jgi:hypothetical protein